MVSIIQNVIDMIGYFADVATAFPTSFILVLTGFALVTIAVAVFGYLTAGAIVDFIIPESPGRKPPQRG